MPNADFKLSGIVERGFADIVEGMEKVLFYDICNLGIFGSSCKGLSFVVVWLILGAVFFTLRLGFVNLRMFAHGFQVVRGRYSKGDEPGEVTHFQALSAAVSATVGLGNIAGVAVAVSLGGPGAVVWMAIAGFFCMSLKFAEVTLGHKYRLIDEDGKVLGGAFRYLSLGLAERGMGGLGKALASIFALFCLGGAFGAGNMFQSNQTVTMLTETFPAFSDMDWAVALVLAGGVGVVLIGGLKRIATVAEFIVPFMALIYLTAALVVIGVNADKVPDALGLMFRDAFTGQAVAGGLFGVIIMGFRRAAFSNEAGAGSAPIAHSAAKTTEPVREGCVALLEPFIDTIVICFVTGLLISVTGVWAWPEFRVDDGSPNGVLLTSAAFATVIDWFPNVLAVCIVLFAFSTMITWSYYGEKAWHYLFGKRSIGLYHMIFCSLIFFGGIINFGIVLNFSDLLFLGMSIPNLIGLYLMQGVLRREVKDYIARLKAGEFPVYK